MRGTKQTSNKINKILGQLFEKHVTARNPKLEKYISVRSLILKKTLSNKNKNYCNNF